MLGPESKPLISSMFIVAVASSAGGLTALSKMLSELPQNFAAPIIIVQHISPNHASFLAEILGRRTALKVKQAEENDIIRPGIVYVAPPNRHVLFKSENVLMLSQSEPLHFLRPSANLLFESLAKCYRERAVAVILTGTGTDGSEGIKAVKVSGGIVIAQDEATSEFFGMPNTAIQSGYVDYVLPLKEIASFLNNLVTTGNVK